MIQQGDVFWIDLGAPSGSGPGLSPSLRGRSERRYNRSRIGTVVVCSLTSNLKRAEAPGNVLLDEGEGNLPKRSVVNISQMYTVDKEDLVERIGTLSLDRVQQVLDGIYLLLEPRDVL